MSSLGQKEVFIREKIEPSYTAGGSVEMVFPFWKNSMIISQKVLTELPHSLAGSLLGIY